MASRPPQETHGRYCQVCESGKDQMREREGRVRVWDQSAAASLNAASLWTSVLEPESGRKPVRLLWLRPSQCWLHFSLSKGFVNELMVLFSTKTRLNNSQRGYDRIPVLIGRNLLGFLTTFAPARKMFFFFFYKLALLLYSAGTSDMKRWLPDCLSPTSALCTESISPFCSPVECSVF